MTEHQEQSLNHFDSQEFQQTLRQIHQQMLVSEKEADYVRAEELRLKGYNYRKRWEEDYLAHLDRTYSAQAQQLQQSFSEKGTACDEKWEKALEDYRAECEEHLRSSRQRHHEDNSRLREQMTLDWPEKVKESHQLLNLREMERHMAKQKNFPQAHLVQQKIKSLYGEELIAWHTERDRTIQQAVSNANSRYQKETELFQQRRKTQTEDHNFQWHQERINLQQRCNLELKELKASHERTVLSFTKQFTTKGGVFWYKPDDSASSVTSYA